MAHASLETALRIAGLFVLVVEPMGLLMVWGFEIMEPIQTTAS